MMKTPISLIIDDPAPRVLAYYAHIPGHTLKDGRAIPREVPNSFMEKFCDIIERYSIRGKFSVIPMPLGEGNILTGIPGIDQKEVDEWLTMAKDRVSKLFSICPEMLTHAEAVDLKTNTLLPMNEEEWSNAQTADTLTPYIARALTMLKDAGLFPSGVTSPWSFGCKVESAYAESVAKAFFEVFKQKNSWYFLHCLGDKDGIKPWIAYEKDGLRTVSIPATTDDMFWQTMNTTDTSDEYVSIIADQLISMDGKTGRIIDILKSGGYPILLTHWQSLFSNGAGTGLRALCETAKRIEMHLSDTVQWTSSEELMRMTLDHPADYPKPAFL
ncbi:MAG: hypothetical protein IJC48_01850 [Clostridia bacterium]|nr:hypothetical protein [Clostridia bacterium]